jgi:hypothetical protein
MQSRYYGVYSRSEVKSTPVWRACFKKKSLGQFASEEEAARAYDSAMLELPPDQWRRLNFPVIPAAPVGAKMIQLTRNQWAVVDEEDYEELNKYEWCAAPRSEGGFYAVSRDANNRIVRMHSVILRPGLGKTVDHQDGNSLDNRKQNLRQASPSQNMFNKRKQTSFTSSLYKGVSYRANIESWCCSICISKRRTTIGYFKDEKQAALAYNLTASSVFAEFALLNEVNEEPTELTIQKATKAISKVKGIKS